MNSKINYLRKIIRNLYIVSSTAYSRQFFKNQTYKELGKYGSYLKTKTKDVANRNQFGDSLGVGFSRQKWYCSARFGSTYTKIGTIQRRLAWPLRKDDTQTREAFHIFLNQF